jgi:hypothetical protein
MCLGELSSLLHHSRTARRCGCQHDFRAEKAHESAALDAERLGHRDNERVPLRSAYHRESDTGIAACRLNNCLSGLQRAGFLCVFDHAERETILDRAKGIESFHLDVKIDSIGRETIDPDSGRVSNGTEDVWMSSHCVID